MGQQQALPLSHNDRLSLMHNLGRVVRLTGEHVLRMMPDKIVETVQDGLHQYSTVDVEAGTQLRRVVAEIFGTTRYTLREESEIPNMLVQSQEVLYPLMVFDAVEGATNAKRGLAAALHRPILAGTSVMVLESESLSSIAASAFFDFASNTVFTSMRTEPRTFLSFQEGRVINPQTVAITLGDSHPYVIVPGYSHANVQARAEVEQVLLNAGFSPTGGTRSSAQDMLSILTNQCDAYVDLRAHFPGGSTNKRDEVLHSWDVGGILPVMEGLDFEITDAKGQGWQEAVLGKPLALVVARKALGQRILEAIQGLSFLAGGTEEGGLLSFRIPTERLGGA